MRSEEGLVLCVCGVRGRGRGSLRTRERPPRDERALQRDGEGVVVVFLRGRSRLRGGSVRRAFLARLKMAG